MIIYKHADLKDISSIIQFLKENWSSNHVLIQRPDIFSHYYLPVSKIPNYFLAFNDQGRIVGTLGYITNKMFSDKVEGNGAWLSMWCVTPGLTEPVGFNLLRILEDRLLVDFISTFGAGLDTLPYYNKLGYTTGAAEHWKCNLDDCNKLNNVCFVTDKLSSEKIKKNSIGKNKEYLKNKFIETGFYKYLSFNIFNDGELITSIVGRVIEYPAKKIRILRIIDFTGDIHGIVELAIYLANHEKYEHINYVDILLGFIGKSESLSPVFSKSDSDNYLPLYFEPLITEYKQKYFVYKSNSHKFRNNIIVTGDCDQDRPNQ